MNSGGYTVMRISNNISALTAFNAVTQNMNQLQDTVRQLSTGLRINSASDDAAGLALSEAMRSQINGLGRAVQNAQDGISLLQTAEGALGETNSILQRMRELTVQGANDTLTSQDRNYIQMEIDALKSQIDRIAETTQFNKKRLLDGSCCGACTSSDTSTKGYIRGAINVEGNYRLDIRTNPGQAQVQKSSIFKVKHDNTVTNLQADSESGIVNIGIDNVPAGDFQITATKVGGGATTTTYTSSAKINIANANTSNVNETLLLRFTGKTSNGNEISWPYYPYYSNSNFGGSPVRNGNDYYYKITVPSTNDTEQETAQTIASKLNGQKITLAGRSGVNPVEFTLKAELDSEGNCVVTSSSTEGEISSVSFEALAGTASRTTINTTHSPRTTYTSTMTGAASGSNGSNTSIQVNITDGTSTGTYTVPGIMANMTAAQITSAIQGIGSQSITLSNGNIVTLNGGSAPGAANFYTLNVSGGSSSSLSLSLSPSGIFSNSTPSAQSITTYTSTGSGTVSSGNTSPNEERIRVYLSTSSSSNSNSNDYIEITAASGATQAQIAEAIVNAVNSKGSMNYNNSSSAIVQGNYTPGSNDYTLTAVGSGQRLYFRAETIPTVPASVSVPDQSFSVDESFETAPGADVNLTGFYGFEDAADSINANVTVNAKNNASILFEVTNAITDSNGTTVTLSASSNVLGTDGTQSRYEKSKITFSTKNSESTVDISSLLGEEAGSLTLKLDPAKFAIGNKFVLSVSGNGSKSDNTQADTSLYIKANQDSTWPYNWGEHATYKNNELYYNVNAGAVSNSELHFRNYYLNSDNGNVHEGDIKLTLNENFASAAKNFVDPPSEGEVKTNENLLASFTSNYVGKTADADTKLRDLEQFWDKSGVFMLTQPQTITISQKDGRKTSITLNESDTLNDVRRKLNNAIANDLDQGRYVKGGNANNIVTYVETPSQSGIESVKGTFLIRSLVPGSAGELTFSSDNGDLIDSLGLNTVQEAQGGSYTVSVYNAHDNTAVAQNVKTSGNILEGVIDKNIDVEFAPMSGVHAVWSESDKNFIFSSEPDSYSTNLHIVKNNIAFQTGSNNGEEINLDIGDMSSQALGLDSVNVTSHDRASQSIAVLDRAIRRVSSQRSKLGSYQNALEHTIEDLTLTNTNLTAAESRIRDADMSKSMFDLVKFQIINQTSTSMLAQANQLPQNILSLLQ